MTDDDGKPGASKTQLGFGVVPGGHAAAPTEAHAETAAADAEALPPAILLTPEMAIGAVAVPTMQAPVETLSRHFLGISLRRAFRLQIHTDEVLPSERAHLESQARPHHAIRTTRRSSRGGARCCCSSRSCSCR